MTFFPKRTHTCGELRLSHNSKRVTLNGWIEGRRDLGKLIFLDLRDRYGLVQVALDTSDSAEVMAAGHELRPEYVIAVEGVVRPRPPEALNPSMETGEIEVAADSIVILNPSATPPFEVSDEVQVSDEIRMRYRYLDLRRPSMRQSLILRHKVLLAIRNALSDRGFLEIETPLLTKSTPEGARDYLVPSRVQPGRFYALPQSPQLFKQLLMVGGMDRYFQIVKCLRDEDLRADRQPEFTQLDMELSFVEEEEVFQVMEEVIGEVMRTAGYPEPKRPFPRMTYDEAVTRFGSDKPDTRFAMELFDVTETARGCGFKVFRSTAEGGGAVMGIVAPGCGAYSRKEIDGLVGSATELGAKGLAWFKVTAEGLSSSIAKFFEPGEQQAILQASGAQEGDLILIVADKVKTTRHVLSELRLEMGRRLRLMGEAMHFLWVTDFPMFDLDDETGALVPSHHPFTTPLEEYEGQLEKDPAGLKARSYDLVLNGVELGSGSVRIHESALQARIFNALGIGAEKAREKFGFLLDAFTFGAPPHAGIALGLDRLVMLLAGKNNIREVIAFPKTASAACPLTGAPAEVDPAVLEELKIAVVRRKNSPPS